MNSTLAGFSRRAFLQAAAALPIMPATYAVSAGSEEILPGLRLIRGAVNTARLDRHGRTLLIDSGDITSLLSGYNVNRFNWLAKSARFSVESDG